MKHAPGQAYLPQACSRISCLKLLVNPRGNGDDQAGYRVVNIDSTVIAQQPKLNPHIQAIRAKLAETLGIPLTAISVKAKTNEGVGPEGREEAISVQAVALLDTVIPY